MGTNYFHEQLQLLEDQIYTDLDDNDEESVASLETDDGEDHPPERILAQVSSKNGLVWYLVKWTNCPILRSSWEGQEQVADNPWLFDQWLIERQKQLEGKSKPLDIAAFQKAQFEVELAERRRRILRRLKRKLLAQHRKGRSHPLSSTRGNSSNIFNMVNFSMRSLLGLTCLSLAVLAGTISSPGSADTEIICSPTDTTDCYSRVFQPTKDFQVIKEGQDLPPGLHVRMDIYTGLKEARLNIPMEGEEGAIDALKDIPTEQAIVVVEQPEAEQDKPAMRYQVPMKPSVYESAGKIPPPPPSSGDEFGTFQKALLAIKMEARAFDSALDDLSELSHDIYYGLEIAKDGPVLEKLICLALGSGSEKIPAHENNRDHKAASILGSALQNNPTALKEVSNFWRMVMYPNCAGATESKTQSNFVSILRSRLGREKDPLALKAKLITISGLLNEPLIRDEFLEKGGMELLLAIFLKKGDQFDIVRKRVAQLVTDTFLDEGMGAQLGVWPKMPVSEAKVCERKERMLGEGCWEYHVEDFLVRDKKAGWAKEFLDVLTEQREKYGVSMKDREL